MSVTQVIRLAVNMHEDIVAARGDYDLEVSVINSEPAAAVRRLRQLYLENLPAQVQPIRIAAA
jgi:hypothetical protein